MLKDNFFSRVFIRVVIICLRLITPACSIYLLTRFIYSHVPSKAIPVPVRLGLLPVDYYATFEITFYLIVYLPRRWYLNRPALSWNPLSTPEERRVIFEKTWEATRDPRGYLSLWFKKADVDALRREDVKDWIHWRLWNGTEREKEHEDEVEQYTKRLEDIIAMSFKPERSQHTAMMVTTEPLRMAHRPLLWYQGIVGAVDTQLFLQMWFHGYQYFAPPLRLFPRAFPFRPLALLGRHRSPARHLSYFYRPHKTSERLPVLFIHGIGIGLGFYLPFLSQFAKENPNVGIICLEILPISSRITHAPLRPETMAREVQQILTHHGWERVLLMTHSYGSVVAAQLLHSPLSAASMGPLLFVDPVTFSFHPPEVAWNFLRRKPTTASEHQLQYFASLDAGVAQALTRSFVWTENSLWREDVEARGARCTVALSGRDIITDTDALGAYITREPKEGLEWYEEPEEWQSDEWKELDWTGSKALEVLWFPDLNHSEVFDAKTDRDRLSAVVETYSRR